MEENQELVDEEISSQEEITEPQEMLEESNEVDFESEADGAEGNSEESEEDVTKPQEEEKPKKQSKSENAYFAQKRREQEEIQKRREDEAEKRGLLRALKGTDNPFTGEPIQDQDDVEEYLLMKQAKEAGFDPVSELSKFQKHTAREERKKQESGFDVKADVQAFKEKYPDTDINELVADKEFAEFAEPFAQKIPLATIYAQYQLMKSRVDATAKVQAETKYKRKMASPGSMTGGADKPISIDDMSDAEFEAMVMKAKRGELKKT
jgi:hypothetical protein